MSIIVSSFFGGLLGWFASPLLLILLLIAGVITLSIFSGKLKYIFILVGAVGIFLTIKFIPVLLFKTVEWTTNSGHIGLILGITIFLLVIIAFTLHELSKMEKGSKNGGKPTVILKKK